MGSIEERNIERVLLTFDDAGLIVSDHSYSRDSTGAAENDPRKETD